MQIRDITHFKSGL